jgi:hypothetical protein
MRKFSDQDLEKIKKNTHFLSNNSFVNVVPFTSKYERYGIAREAIDDVA